MNKNLEEAIQTSGNNLHIDTVRLLENSQHHFTVKVSSYYNDDITGKPREIDIVAEREVVVSDNLSGRTIETFKIFLFIDCKNFTEEIAFWTQPNSNQEASAAIILESLDKNYFSDGDCFHQHHYLTPSTVAKLHFTPKKQENEVFESLTQPIKAICFFKELRKERGIYYPLIVYSGIDGTYQGNNYDTASLNNLSKEACSIYSLNYSYRSPLDKSHFTQRFYIDFVHFSKLQDYIDKTIIPEAIALRDFIQFEYKVGRYHTLS